jgi:hypothetical protein
MRSSLEPSLEGSLEGRRWHLVHMSVKVPVTAIHGVLNKGASCACMSVGSGQYSRMQ